MESSAAELEPCDGAVSPSGPFFDDVRAGQELPLVSKGPMSTLHIMRWSSAIENWHRIHYDQPFATSHDGLPNVLVNGSWKQHVLAQAVSDWAGPSGHVSHIKFSYRGMDFVGATIVAFGTVTGLEPDSAWGWATCDIGLRDETGETSTEGTALVALPFRDGPALPDPVPARS